MKQVFKKILLTSLVLVPFTMHASIQTDVTIKLEENYSDYSNSLQIYYPSLLELNYQNLNTTNYNDYSYSTNSYTPIEPGPLYSPSDPADPNVPIDTNLYFLLAAALVYGFVLFRKEKRLKL
jgi:hypothetical protein